MSQHSRDHVRYVVIDGERHLFNLFGPARDDAEITRLVAALQARKRQVYIVNYEDPSLSDAQVIADAAARYRSEYTKESIV